MPFSKIYQLLLDKVVRKGRTQDELDEVIYWLTGHNRLSLEKSMEVNVYEFYSSFPRLNEFAYLIKGVICKVRIEDIEDEVERNIRYLDKLVDELSKGKRLEVIKRS